MDSLKPSGEAQRALENAPFLRRVSLRNYKSIESADVSLGALTVLVGRNGSGKSNFLDALRFLSESLRTSLDHAIRSRGGFEEIKRRLKTGRWIGDLRFSIEVELVLPSDQVATYGFGISNDPDGGLFSVRSEILRVHSPAGLPIANYFVRSGMVVQSSVGKLPPAFEDRLYLVNASGFPEFRPCYEALSSMSFYDLNPVLMRSPQPPNTGDLLQEDGSNLASIVARLKPEAAKRITQYLSAIVPGIIDFGKVSLGPLETLIFKQQGDGSSPFEFFSWSMSDGTLRALGALVAVNQRTGRDLPVSLVGIEEPETALHPAAAGALMDALREASSHTQIVATSHSPDLLDQVDLDTDCLLAVVSEKGKTLIAPIDEASREAIRRHLYTPGELLRLDQLEPDRKYLRKQEQTDLALDEDEA